MLECRKIIYYLRVKETNKKNLSILIFQNIQYYFYAKKLNDSLSRNRFVTDIIFCI